ncbi:hypothetical protein HYH03_012336 [Edaphochlamys debaryana]|uniref:Uncharacterized protein n=1 Tax=Edaphochlamys debaryana TaxID=47281 RepID=A0A835XYB0_9CHLO|nr:hypothetical protein HYH03_012336 [Edaphochlamys debaryana]|eukprot:KAG2489110.1 hypothetical protein HYH03_012336 [Edaphochlamys debaryana]
MAESIEASTQALEQHRHQADVHRREKAAILSHLQHALAKADSKSGTTRGGPSTAVDLRFLPQCILTRLDSSLFSWEEPPPRPPQPAPAASTIASTASQAPSALLGTAATPPAVASQPLAQPELRGRPLVSLMVQYFNRPWMLPALAAPLRRCMDGDPDPAPEPGSGATTTTGRQDSNSSSSDSSSDSGAHSSSARNATEASSGTAGPRWRGLGFGIEMLLNVDSRSDAAEVAAFAASPAGAGFVVPVFSNNVHEIRSYNRLAQLARGKILIMMQDDDVLPDRSACTWLASVVRVFRRWPRMGAVGSQRYVFNYHPNTTDLGVHFWDPAAGQVVVEPAAAAPLWQPEGGDEGGDEGEHEEGGEGDGGQDDEAGQGESELEAAQQDGGQRRRLRRWGAGVERGQASTSGALGHGGRAGGVSGPPLHKAVEDAWKRRLRQDGGRQSVPQGAGQPALGGAVLHRRTLSGQPGWEGPGQRARRMLEEDAAAAAEEAETEGEDGGGGDGDGEGEGEGEGQGEGGEEGGAGEGDGEASDAFYDWMAEWWDDGRLRMQFVSIIDYAPIAVRRSAFLHIGGIDANMAESGACGVHSDYDFTMRMWLAGWQVSYVELPGLGKDPNEEEGGTHRKGVAGYCWERQWDCAINYMRTRWGQRSRWDPESYYWFGSDAFEVITEHVRLLNVRLLASLADPPGSYCPFGYGCGEAPVDNITGTPGPVRPWFGRLRSWPKHTRAPWALAANGSKSIGGARRAHHARGGGLLHRGTGGEGSGGGGGRGSRRRREGDDARFVW